MNNVRAFLYMIFLAACNIQLSAQFAPTPQMTDKYIVIDSASYIITYDVDIINDPSKPNKITTDIHILQIGKNLSKTYSLLLFKGDSISTAMLKKGARSSPWFQELVPPVEVYRNYPIGKQTVTHRTFFSGPIFRYEEPMIFFQWKLLPERKRILSYNCQKAITEFRGRTYEAWFAPEIPLKEGPYKFNGLPGLILEINDMQQHYTYKCVGIEHLKRKVPIKLWKWKFQEIEQTKMNKLLRSFYKNPTLFFQSTGVKFHGNTKTLTFPYNPIELE